MVNFVFVYVGILYIIYEFQFQEFLIPPVKLLCHTQFLKQSFFSFGLLVIGVCWSRCIFLNQFNISFPIYSSSSIQAYMMQNTGKY